MDTSILIFTIFGIILWIDNKRRNKRIKVAMDFARQYKTPRTKVVSIETPDEDEIKNMLLEIRTDLLKDEKVISVDTNDDDAILKETIQEVIKEMEVPKNNLAVQDAEIALKKLGYKQLQIKKSIHTILETSDEIPSSSDIVTRALTILNN